MRLDLPNNAILERENVKNIPTTSLESLVSSWGEREIAVEYIKRHLHANIAIPCFPGFYIDLISGWTPTPKS